MRTAEARQPVTLYPGIVGPTPVCNSTKYCAVWGDVTADSRRHSVHVRRTPTSSGDQLRSTQ